MRSLVLLAGIMRTSPLTVKTPLKDQIDHPHIPDKGEKLSKPTANEADE